MDCPSQQRGRFVVVEDLQNGSAGVEVIRGFGVSDLWDKRSFGSGDIVPVDITEERMILDLFCAVCSKASGGIERHKAIHEVVCLGRNLDVFFMPLDVPRKDVLEHLFWSVSVERGDAIEELIGDDTQSPLRYVPDQ